MRKVFMCPAWRRRGTEGEEFGYSTLVVKIWPYVKHDAASSREATPSVATAFDYQGAKSTLLCSTTFPEQRSVNI